MMQGSNYPIVRGYNPRKGDHALVLLFAKFVSDTEVNQSVASITVPKDGSYAELVALKGHRVIGDIVHTVIAKIMAKPAATNELIGVTDVAGINDLDYLGGGKAIQDCRSNLVAVSVNHALDVRRNHSEGNDLFSHA